ncbi:hypothetical protein Lesp02_71290 [Lentzea sp. NBRC 105346]|nr:hypothetical protein Lesp02_71290 [Lentzea sp. NBRC 105346]
MITAHWRTMRLTGQTHDELNGSSFIEQPSRSAASNIMLRRLKSAPREYDHRFERSNLELIINVYAQRAGGVIIPMCDGHTGTTQRNELKTFSIHIDTPTEVTRYSTPEKVITSIAAPSPVTSAPQPLRSTIAALRCHPTEACPRSSSSASIYRADRVRIRE